MLVNSSTYVPVSAAGTTQVTKSSSSPEAGGVGPAAIVTLSKEAQAALDADASIVSFEDTGTMFEDTGTMMEDSKAFEDTGTMFEDTGTMMEDGKAFEDTGTMKGVK
ncbi:MAG: hypothetical protein ACI8S6_003923 [Myxococcota bacterium]|jgi:hypothetical protein